MPLSKESVCPNNSERDPVASRSHSRAGLGRRVDLRCAFLTMAPHFSGSKYRHRGPTKSLGKWCPVVARKQKDNGKDKERIIQIDESEFVIRCEINIKEEKQRNQNMQSPSSFY